jgi:AcrR family transcriptional regulator
MSKHRHSVSARNLPQQSRSKATVTAILDGTIRILEQSGWEETTTSRVAEVAGVSVGTLYQYFSNRDAILDALQEREFERATEVMQRVLQTGTFDSDLHVARAVLKELLELYAHAPALHRVLIVEGFRVTPTAKVLAFDLRMVTAIRGFLAAANVNIRRSNHDAAAFVAFHSVRAAMLAWLLEKPPGVDSGVLVEELTDLLLRYLVEDPCSSGT